MINVKQIAKFVVGLGDRVAPSDIDEGMRVGYVSLCVCVRVYECMHPSPSLSPSFTPSSLSVCACL